MIPPIQKKSFDRVAGLILEEIEGCELDPEAQETRDLRRIVALLQEMAKDQVKTKPKQKSLALKPVVHSQVMKPEKKQKPVRKGVKKWMTGPLAQAETKPAPKPPWFSE